MQTIELTASDGVTTQTKRFTEGTTINQALEVMDNYADSDYLGLTYTLWVNGLIYCETEC